MSPFGIEKIFSFVGKKDEQKIESPEPSNVFKIDQIEPQQTADKEIKPESKETTELYGFKIGEKILLRDSLKGEDIFKTREAEIAGPAKNANQIQIKIDNPDSPFKPKLTYEIHVNDLIKLNEQEQRILKEAGVNEVRHVKNLLISIEKLEERVKDTKERKGLDKPFEEKLWEFKKLGQQFKNDMFKEKIDKKALQDLRIKLSDLSNKLSDMLDNLEENYPSDDLERIRTRRGYGK